MAWITLDTGNRINLSKNTVTTMSYESRTITALRDKTVPRYINGVESGTVVIKEQYQYEQRRKVETDTTTTVDEFRGLTKAAALAATADGTSSFNTTTGAGTFYGIERNRSHESEGWKVTKTKTEISITRGAWATYTES